MADGRFVKGQKKPNQGKRGPNKTTLAAKEAIEKVAEGLGGPDRMLEWVKLDEANERTFWSSIYPKLLPLTVTGKDGRDLIPPVIQFVRGED